MRRHPLFSRALAILLTLVSLTGVASAQTALTSTTLAAALGATDTSASLTSASGWSASTTSVQRYAIVDREVMGVRTLSGTLVGLNRGQMGTRQTAHASGTTIYFVDGALSGDVLSAFDRAGSCATGGSADLTQNAKYVPVFNPSSGRYFYCLGSVWVPAGLLGGSMIESVNSSGKTTLASVGTNQDLVLDASGTGSVTTADGVLSSSVSKGIGYATGAGCAVTQATSKSTGVTCTGVSGAITMNNAALANGAEVGFTVTNTSVAATDVVIVSIKSGATADSYSVTVDAVAAGSFRISVSNVSGGSLSEALVLNFVVIKGVAA